MPLPDNCCDCTCKSFCNETAAVIRRLDGSYDPPKVPRVVQRPGPDGANVPAVENDWLLYGPESFNSEINIGLPGVNTDACAWHLVAGSHSLASFELAPTWIPRPALESVLATAGLSLASVQVSEPRAAVDIVNAAIAARTVSEQAQFWNDLIAAGFRDLWFNVAFRRDIALTTQGTVLTRTTANKPVQVVELRIGATARQAGDTSGTLFTFDPLTTDVRIGCDETGGNQQYTLRVRVEHGAQIEPVTYAPDFDGVITDPGRYFNGSSSWGNSDLQCHSFIPHSQAYTGQFQSGGPISAVEARVYLEILNSSGQSIESVLVPAFNVRRLSLLGGVGVRWSWSIADGQLHANANVNFILQNALGEVGTTDAEDQAGTNIGIGADLRVLRHLFTPVALELPSRIAVAMPRANRHAVTVRHRQFRLETTQTSNGLSLSPSIPVDVSPYCDTSHQDYAANQQPGRWPWRKTNCTVWRRHGGRVTQARSGFTECILTLTSDPEWAGIEGTFPQGTLITGPYNLGKTTTDGVSLLDNTFWFSDEPNSSVALGPSSTLWLRRIEFSLTVGGSLSLPCNGQWGMAGYLRGRAVFERTGIPLMSWFFGETLAIGNAFLFGEAFDAVSSLPAWSGVGQWMQWYMGGPEGPFTRPSGANSTFGGVLDFLKPLSELKLQLVE